MSLLSDSVVTMITLVLTVISLPCVVGLRVFPSAQLTVHFSCVLSCLSMTVKRL